MKLEVDVRLALKHVRGVSPADQQLVLDYLLDNLIQQFESTQYDFDHSLWSITVVASRLIPND